MSIEKELLARAESKCELCESTENLGVFEVPPSSDGSVDKSILACNTCKDQIENPDNVDPNHWRALNNTMWNTNPPVQVMIWRMLHRLKGDGWSQDLLDMMYIEEDILEWAASTGEGEDPDDKVIHKDSNGVTLNSGDAVVLIKDLDVKGATFTAKRGTVVRGISLVHDNPEHIEGRVNGQQIVILTKFVKKS